MVTKLSTAGRPRAKVRSRSPRRPDQLPSDLTFVPCSLSLFSSCACYELHVVFAVPETHSWFHHLASPSSRKSSLDLLTLFSMGFQWYVSTVASTYSFFRSDLTFCTVFRLPVGF